MIKIEEIVKELEKSNWKLLSTKYINLNSLMDFECPEGHKVNSTWKVMRNKLSCPICNKNSLKSTSFNLTIPPRKKGTNRILALDQATHVSGYSIFDGKELITFGTYKTNSALKEAERIHEVKCWLLSMIQTAKPDLVGIEGIQFQQQAGVTTFQTLARLQGVLIEICLENDIPFEVVPTNTWRHHCTIKGAVRYDKKVFTQKW